MKLGICADIHFGRGGAASIQQYAATFREMISQMIDADIKCAIFAGDIFHKYYEFTADTFNVVASGCQQLIESGCHVVMIPGSHDFAANGTKAAIEALRRIGVEVHMEITTLFWYKTAITFVPWIPKVGLKAAAINADLGANEMCQEIHEKIVIPKLQEGITEANKNYPDAFKLCIFHASLIGFSPCDFAGDIIGTDFLLDPEQIIGLGYDMMIGGHFHRHEIKEINGRKVCYVGSMERNNFTEADYSCGWMELSGGQFVRHELTSPQKFYEYEGVHDGGGWHDDIGIDDFAGAFVKLKVRCSKHDNVDEDALRGPFMADGARDVKIERIYTDEIQVRAQIKADQSEAQQFDAWAAVNVDKAAGLKDLDEVERLDGYNPEISDADLMLLADGMVTA